MADFRISKDKAKRFLEAVEGYMELELFDLAAKQLDEIEKAGWFPLEVAIFRGEIYRVKKNFGIALPYFRKALLIEPGNPLATLGLGWCLKRLNMVPQAIETYKQSIRVNPQIGLLHFNLSCYQSLHGERKEAIRSLYAALTIDAERYRELARSEKDLDPIRNDPDFRKIIYPV